MRIQKKIYIGYTILYGVLLSVGVLITLLSWMDIARSSHVGSSIAVLGMCFGASLLSMLYLSTLVSTSKYSDDFVVKESIYNLVTFMVMSVFVYYNIGLYQYLNNGVSLSMEKVIILILSEVVPMAVLLSFVKYYLSCKREVVKFI